MSSSIANDSAPGGNDGALSGCAGVFEDFAHPAAASMAMASTKIATLRGRGDRLDISVLFRLVCIGRPTVGSQGSAVAGRRLVRSRIAVQAPRPREDGAPWRSCVRSLQAEIQAS